MAGVPERSFLLRLHGKNDEKLLQLEHELEILEIYQSDDVREGRPRWLNVLVKKRRRGRR